MDPREFIVLAGKLAAMGKAGARSSVSRAYYGNFHIAAEMIESLAGEACAGGKAHNLVPIYLETVNHADGTAAANLLKDLHAARIRVDYRLADTRAESTEFAKNCVEMAVEIQRRLELFLLAARNDEALCVQLSKGIAQIKAAFKL